MQRNKEASQARAIVGSQRPRHFARVVQIAFGRSRSPRAGYSRRKERWLTMTTL
jgi:hypothetical protein